MSRGTWESRPGSLLPLPYGAITLYGQPFQAVRLGRRLVTPWIRRTGPRQDPTTPLRQRIRPLTSERFGLFPFRSPLLGESRLISFPRGTKMFQFPRFASRPYGFRPG